VACPNCGAKTLLDDPSSSCRRRPSGFPNKKIRPNANQELPAAPLASRIIDNIEKVIVGKRNEIVLTLVALLAEGHLLLEDVPGVAKTMLARALARSLGCTFKRIQCTPDLLPNDITGSSIFNPKTTDFEFRPGPLFAQSCWPMKSIAPRPARNRRSWKRWPNARSRPMASTMIWLRRFF